MHPWDSNETLGEKVDGNYTRLLHFEQILETAPYKTVVKRPLNILPSCKLSTANETCKEIISYVLLWIPIHGD